MPTIQVFKKCKIEIRFREHNPPHFHIVMNDDRTALVHIKDLEVKSNEVSLNEIKEAIEWAKKNKSVLMFAWRRNNP